VSSLGRALACTRCRPGETRRALSEHPDRSSFANARRLVVTEDYPVAPRTHLRRDFLEARLEGGGGVDDQLAHLLGKSVSGANAPVDIAIRMQDMTGVRPPSAVRTEALATRIAVDGGPMA